MTRLSKRALMDALQRLGRVDGTAKLGVHRSQDPPRRRGQIPPFLLPAYQREPLTSHDTASPPAQTAVVHDSAARLLLGYRAFERLSLLARTLLFIRLTDRATDAVARKAQEALDRKAHKLLASLSIDWDMTEVDADHIVDVLDAMAFALSESDATPAHAHYRQGLQIVGCRITRSHDKTAPLNLSNRRLPFPISFVGCTFDMPLMVNEAEMISLDLSGSALPGLEARGLRTTGGVHLRRSTVISSVSFSSARVGGLFDASDGLFNQVGPTPPQQVEDADHGVLNLSKAIIGNEVLLERTRVWGGLSLRGMEAQRSVFLTGAMVASPMAVLEKWAFDILNEQTEALRAYEPLRTCFEAMREFGEYTERLAAFLLHDPTLPRGRGAAPEADPKDGATVRRLNRQQPLLQLECVLGDDWHAPSMEILLTESLRARTNAIRGDGLKILGNLFAEHLRAYGRVRLKSAQVAGSIRLAGAVLRSGEESRTAMNEIQALHEDRAKAPDRCRSIFDGLGEIVALRERTACALDPQPGFVPQDYALDLREAIIDGDVSFAPGEQTTNDRTRGEASPHALHPAELHGVLALGGATLKGSLHAQAVRFKWRPGAGEGAAKLIRLRDRQALHDYDLTLRQVAHETDQNAAPRPAPDATAPPPRPSDLRPLIDQYALDMRQCTVGRDVDLRRSDGLWGLHLEEAHIHGRVRFSKPHRGAHVDRNRRIPLEERATNVSGRINLRGTRIEGDCALLHHPDFGPEIKAVKCVVDGRLSIYPTGTANRYVLDDGDEAAWRSRSKDQEATPAPASFEWRPCDHIWVKVARNAPSPSARDGSRRYCKICNLERAPRLRGGDDRREWVIDLRNARATIFSHPPSAWPHPGALSLDGFRYERSCSLGPLPAILAEALRRRRGEPAGQPAANAVTQPASTLWDRLRNGPDSDLFAARVGGAILMMIVLACCAILVLPLWNQRLWAVCALSVFLLVPWRQVFIGQASENKPTLWQALQPGSRRTDSRKALLALLATALAGVLAREIMTEPWLLWAEFGFRLVLAAITAVATTQLVFRWVVSHPYSQHAPLGLEYLSRQRSEPNRFQFLTSRYSPNEPYRIAALALRETGRYLAANEIERKRIQNRQKILSWRMHGISKLSLVLADKISGFGFKLDRLASVVVTSIVVVAFATHLAANYGWLELDPDPPKWGLAAIRPTPPAVDGLRLAPIDDPRIAAPTTGKFRSCRERADFATLKTEQSPWASVDEDARVCPGWMYAFDLLFPIDLGEPHWKVPEARLNTFSGMPFAADLARNIIAIVQLYGALLAAFFIAALALRAEAAFVRIEE